MQSAQLMIGLDRCLHRSPRSSVWGCAVGVLALGSCVFGHVVPLDPVGALFDAGFGRSCTGIGDVNGDGIDDVVVGVPGEYLDWPPPPVRATGAAYVYSGADGSIIRRLVSPRRIVGGQFGVAVAAADVDGDSIADILIGAYFEGAVDCFSGADGSIIYTLQPSNPNAAGFGFEARLIPDCTGDGVDEVAVGAPFE